MSVGSYLRIFIITLSLTAFGCAVAAEPAAAHDSDLRARLRAEDSSPQENSKVLVKHITLDDTASVSVVTRRGWLNNADSMIANVREIHRWLSVRFGVIPQFTTTIRLMDEDSFFLATNAPRWTSALFYRGTIIIPMSANATSNDSENLRRSIRHEFTHSAIHAISGGNCPGWIDEGLAQILEGETLPQIPTVLNNWLSRNSPISLSKLQRGFTKLPVSTVPAAYAQSISAVKLLEEIGGERGLPNYLNALRAERFENAFEESFNMSEETFEQKLRCVLKENSCRYDPAQCRAQCQLRFENNFNSITPVLASDVNHAAYSEQYLAKGAF